MNDETIQKCLKKIFNDRDPLAEAHVAMKAMEKNELSGLVLVAANRIGTILKGEDYEDLLEAAVYFCHGVELIFQAYYSVMMETQATVSEPGNA